MRVGKLLWDKQSHKDLIPVTDGYLNVMVKNYKTGLGHTLSPYFLKNAKGQLMECIWQFSKSYSSVTAQRQYSSKYQYGNSDYLVWEHPAEKHVDEKGEPNNKYWKWRKKGMNNPKPVRYPNGYAGRKK